MRTRVVAWLTGFVGLTVVAVAFAALWLLTTPSGARFVVDRLVTATGNVLTARSIEGTLSTSVELGGVVFSIEHVDASAETATIVLDLRQLLDGRVVIRDLFVSPLTVVPHRPERRPGEIVEPFEAVDLPVDIVLESVAVAGVILEVGGSTYDFEQLTLTLGYAGRVIDVPRFESRFAGFAFSTQASIDLDGAPRIDAVASAAGRYGELDVLVGARAVGTMPALVVDAELLEPTPVTARGPVILNAGPGVSMDIEWSAFDQALLDLLPVENLTIGAGAGRIAGVPDEIAIEASAPVVLDGNPAEITLDARYAPGRIDLVAAELRRDGGVVELAGSMATAEGEFTLDVAGRELDPAWFVPGWDGRVDVGASIAGTIGDRWRVRADGFTAGGIVRGQPFTAAGAGTYSSDREAGIERAELVIGDNRVTVNGRVGADIAVDIDAELTDLSALADGLDGVVTAELRATGSLADPSVEGEIAGRDLVFGSTRIATLSIDGSGGIAAASTVDLGIEARGIVAGGVAAESVTASLAGTAARHTIEVALTAADWRADSRFAGALAADLRWDGTVQALRYSQPPFGEWTLEAPAALGLAPGRAELAEGCLTQGQAELCIGGLIAADAPGRVRVAATDFDLALLRPVLPDGVTARGSYDADIDVSGTRSRFVGRFHLAGEATEVIYARTAEDTVTLMLSRVAADAMIEPDRFESAAEIVGGGDDRLAVTLSGTRRADDAVALDGRIDASWAELAPLSILSRHVGEVGGRATAAIEIGGTLDEPAVDGRAALNDGRLELPIWGVVAESIEAVATSANGETIEFEATGDIDDSTLRLTGATDLRAASGWPTRLNLSGDRVHLVQVADADFYVSPNLDILVDLPRVTVAGTVEVPEALISIAELPAQAVRPSSDAVVHGEVEPERVSPLLLDADIDLVLGDDVRYEGSGLFADLDGGLRLRYSSQTSANAAGTLSVGGRYEAFGQELTLERGELIFTGAIENPTLDMRAVRSVEEIRVGIDLTGTLRSPITRIFSEPPMAEADAVSYLLFGRPLAVPEGAGDPDQLRNAAVALGLRQAVPVIQRIGDSLGLDEFAIESTNVDAGELMAGKYLSPKLYVRYSYGLFNRIGGLLLQYRLNDRLSIETRSGDQKSMDLLYTIEKD